MLGSFALATWIEMRYTTRLLWLFFKEFLSSGLKLIYTIYFRIPSLQSRIFEIRILEDSAMDRIVVAHFITLTPGTLAIEWLDARTLQVHALHSEDERNLPQLLSQRLLPLLQAWHAERNAFAKERRQ